MTQTWNPWHGCKKISDGCKNCYMYSMDEAFGKDAAQIYKTKNYNLPILKDRQGKYKLGSSDYPLYTCITSDFFLKEADDWRIGAWEMIRLREDINFTIITKRIDRFYINLPKDWKEGYENVSILITGENQYYTDKRLEILETLPIKHKGINHEPLLESIDIEKYLSKGFIESVTCGGESGINARLCDYTWVLHIREQCVKYDVPFLFRQTGSNFKFKNKIYHLDKSLQLSQALKAGINYKD